jgi:hypothetical protein
MLVQLLPVLCIPYWQKSCQLTCAFCCAALCEHTNFQDLWSSTVNGIWRNRKYVSRIILNKPAGVTKANAEKSRSRVFVFTNMSCKCKTKQATIIINTRRFSSTGNRWRRRQSFSTIIIVTFTRRLIGRFLPSLAGQCQSQSEMGQNIKFEHLPNPHTQSKQITWLKNILPFLKK